MDRTYLYVPPEDRAAVTSAGAHWDDRLKCWYIGPDDDPARFTRWLGIDREVDLSIISDQAYVAAASVSCCDCGRSIEVICVYCETGTVSSEPLTQFTVTDILAVNEALAKQLSSWPGFRAIGHPGLEGSPFANHCPHCGAEQDDRDLHTEPRDPFFDIPRAAPGAIRLTPLVGEIRLSGDEHFTID